MPKRGFDRTTADGQKISMDWKVSAPAFLSVIAFFVAQGGVWAYMERIGNAQGLDPQFIGTSLSIGMGGSFIGSLIASHFETRFGRKLPLILSAIAQILCIIAIFAAMGKWVYLVAAFVFCTFWNFALPYLIGILIGVDESGKTILGSNTCFAFGIAIAPFIIASFATEGNYLSVGYLGSLALIISLLLALYSNRFIIKPATA